MNQTQPNNSFVPPSREQALADLRRSVYKVTFTKKDGSTRVMYATLLPHLLPTRETHDQPIKESKAKPKAKPNVSVWDIEKSEWRSFYLDKVTGWDMMVTEYPVI